MSYNTFGRMFRITTWGESHGPALGATVDGCPPGIEIDPDFLQRWLDKRKPGQNKNTTQRKEPDAVEILSGVFEGKSTGTPIHCATCIWTFSARRRRMSIANGRKAGLRLASRALS